MPMSSLRSTLGILRRRWLLPRGELVVAAVLVLGGATAAVATRTAGSPVDSTQIEPLAPFATTGVVKKFDGMSLSDCHSAISPDWADIPYTTKTFSIPGTASEEVVVMFQAFWARIDSGYAAYFTLVIDGVRDSQQLRVDPTAGSVPPGLHGFNFISTALSPGPHTAKIQWRVSPAGGVATVCDRSMIVLHK
jgi:hypothetical protein